MRSSAGEHLVHTEGVTGSIPVASTIFPRKFKPLGADPSLNCRVACQFGALSTRSRSPLGWPFHQGSLEFSTFLGVTRLSVRRISLPQSALDCSPHGAASHVRADRCNWRRVRFELVSLAPTADLSVGGESGPSPSRFAPNEISPSVQAVGGLPGQRCTNCRAVRRYYQRRR